MKEKLFFLLLTILFLIGCKDQVEDDYFIIYYYNEGRVIATETYQTAGEIAFREITKPGYRFLGWFYDEELTKKQVTNIMESRNLNLYAGFLKLQYSISFITNSTEEIEGLVLNIDDPLTLPVPTLEEGKFKGWYLDEDYTTLFIDEVMPAKDITLYARWEMNKYRISFYSDFANNVPAMTIEYNSPVTLPVPIKENHSFQGWYYNIGLTKRVEEGLVMPAKNLLLYAKYSNNNHIEYATYPLGTLDASVYDDDGYLLKVTNANNNIYAPFTGFIKEINENKLIIESKNKVLYANGEEDYMSIVFNGLNNIINDLNDNLFLQAEIIGECPENGLIISVFKGKYSNSNKNTINLYDALAIDSLLTKGVITTPFQEKFEYAIFPMAVLHITQGIDGQFSHQGAKALDLGGKDSGIDLVIAPFTGVIKKIYNTNGNFIWLESLQKVRYADGTIDYMTVMIGHANDVSHLYVGKVIKQGEVFYSEGMAGRATGNHIHLEVGRGKYTSNGWYQNSQGVWMIYNDYNPYDALFIDPAFTKTIRNDEDYNWRYSPVINLSK